MEIFQTTTKGRTISMCRSCSDPARWSSFFVTFGGRLCSLIQQNFKALALQLLPVMNFDVTTAIKSTQQTLHS